MGAKFVIMLAMAIMSFSGICEEMPGNIDIEHWQRTDKRTSTNLIGI